MKPIHALVATLLLSASALVAQQTALTNENIVKMAKAGLSEDVIAATVNASPGKYDTSPDGLVKLKTSGVSDKVITLLVQKNSTSTPAEGAPNAAPAVSGPPRVFLKADNAANTWGGILHSQSLEMSKDFARDCPAAKVTVNESAADYVLALNHVEAGFYRDNQLQASDRSGDVVAAPVKYESIAKGVKRSCDAIMADWAAKQGAPER